MNSKFQQLLQSLTKSTIQTLSINSNSRILQTFSGVWNIIKSLRCWNGLKVHIPVSMSILIKCQKSSAVLNNFPCLMKCILIWLYPQSLAHRFFEHCYKVSTIRKKKNITAIHTCSVFNYRNMLVNEHDFLNTQNNWNPFKSYVLSAMSASTPLWPCRWVRRLKKKELNTCVLSRSLSLSTSRKRYLEMSTTL